MRCTAIELDIDSAHRHTTSTCQPWGMTCHHLDQGRANAWRQSSGSKRRRKRGEREKENERGEDGQRGGEEEAKRERYCMCLHGTGQT